MELIQLKQLVTISEEKVLSHAAERLYISQPALSRSIQNLEDELGLQLFDRKKNSMTLNSNGERIVELSRIVLSDAEKIITEANALKDKKQTLHITTCAPAPLWKLTAELTNKYPSLLITSDMPDEDLIEDMILTGKADIGIMRKNFTSTELEAIPFLEEQLYVQIPNSNPLSKNQKFFFKDLEGQTLRLYTGIGFWDKVHRENIHGAKIIESNDFMVHVNIVHASQEIAFVTALSNTYHPKRENCTTLPIEDKDAKATYQIVFLKKSKDKLNDILQWIYESYKKWEE